MTIDEDRFERGDILVVDDTRENLEILSEILGGEGYGVRPVVSGEMALIAAQERKPDLILLDINMPQMSGLEVCRILKTQDDYSDVPIVFITALHDAEHKLLAFQVGGADYITKPFNFEEVKARVRTHLKVRRLLDERRIQNESLRAAHQKLLGLEKLRDNLTHMIVHDLRAPLSGILGSLRFMQEDAAADDGRVQTADLDRALTSAQRLLRLINDLLDIARLEAAQLPLQLQQFDGRELVTRVLDLLEPGKNERIELSTGPGPMVVADQQLIERVLLNLVDNAFKYSPAERPVSVTSSVRSDTWIVSVEDRGPGVPDEFKAKVFEKFGQIEARNARVVSSGLGLAFCKLAVEAHGGNIAMEDRAEGGTRVLVRVPLLPVDAGS